MIEAPGCLSHDRLVSYLLGELPPEQEGEVSAHLESCAACEARAQQIEQGPTSFVQALRRPAAEASTFRGGQLAEEAPGAAPPVEIKGYRILGEIGRGGMGVVYRAYQHRLERVVAVKMILTGQLADA